MFFSYCSTIAWSSFGLILWFGCWMVVIKKIILWNWVLLFICFFRDVNWIILLHNIFWILLGYFFVLHKTVLHTRVSIYYLMSATQGERCLNLIKCLAAGVSLVLPKNNCSTKVPTLPFVYLITLFNHDFG